MFPKTDIEQTENKKYKYDNITLGKCFKFDFEKGQHIIIDGKFIECDFKENIQHFIQVVLRTSANKFKVYIQDEINQFGLSIYNHIGNKSLKRGFIFSEAKREITEQLLNHNFIKDINGFDFNFENNLLIITFNCYLQNDEVLKINEVMKIEF